MMTEFREPSLRTGFPPGTYFAYVAKNMTFAELWRNFRPNALMFTLASIVKIFRIDLKPEIGLAFDGFRHVPLDVIPQFVHDKFEADVAALIGRGYTPLMAGQIPVIGDGDNCVLYYLGPERDRIVNFIYVRVTGNNIDTIEGGITISSQCDDGNYVGTSNVKSNIIPEEGFDIAFRSKWPAADLDDLHSTRLASAAARPVTITPDSAWPWMVEGERTVFEHLIDRGVLRPLTEKEETALKSL